MQWTGLIQTLSAMAALFIVQYTTARFRKASDTFEKVMQNTLKVLMRDGVILDEALAQTRVAKSDLIAKLREANVLSFDKVRAVISETTGDISVLHGDACEQALLDGTQRVDQD